MDTAKRKALLDSYKNRTVIGGVYRITCSGNQRGWLRSTTDLKGAKNRFEQSVSLKGAPEPAMLRELNDYGAASFSFTVLEELKKNETQTDPEFAEDVQTLFELWQEKSKNGNVD